MTSTTHKLPDGGDGPDLRLHDPRTEMRRASGPVRMLGAAAGAVGVGLVAAAYLIAAPFIALGTGIMQIAMDIRDNAVRPRPFTGAAHGFPFLDPPPAQAATSEPVDEED